MKLLIFATLAILCAAAVSFALGTNTSGGGGIHQCPCGPACGCDDCKCGSKGSK